MGGAFISTISRGLVFSLLSATLTLSRGLGGLRNRQADTSGKRLDRLGLFLRFRQVLNQGAARALREDQFMSKPVNVYVHEVAEADLTGSHEIR